MEKDRSDANRTVVEICHRLYDRGYLTATDGNVSVRLENGHILTTRTGINKGAVTEADLVEVGIDGEALPTHHSSLTSLRPSTEIGMHLFIYKHRPEICAVVHAHPTYATGFATARIPLDECLFPEVIVGLGAIPLAAYATPSTEEVARSLEPFVMKAEAILLANHGVVTYGKDLWDAYYTMEKVEHAAHITFVARLLGGEKPLAANEVDKLRAISQQSYGKDFSDKIACESSCGREEKSAGSDEIGRNEDIIEFVRQMLRAKGDER